MVARSSFSQERIVRFYCIVLFPTDRFKYFFRHLVQALLQILGYIYAFSVKAETIVAAIHTASRYLAKHILRVFLVIFIDWYACRISAVTCISLVNISPFLSIRSRLLWIHAFLEHHNICGNLRACILLERIARKLYGANQISLAAKFCSYGHSLSCLALHSARSSNEYQQPARANLIDALCEEIIMDQIAGFFTTGSFLIGRVMQFDGSERNIRNSQVEEIIRQTGFLISALVDICLLIQLFGNLSRKRVKLYSVQVAAGHHFFWHHAEEISCPHRRIQYAAGLEAKTLYAFPYRLDNVQRGIECIQCSLSRCVIFFFGENFVELFVFLRPFRVIRKRRLYRTPAVKSGQHVLFRRRCSAPFCLQLFQEPDSGNIILILGFFSTIAQLSNSGNMVIFAWNLFRLFPVQYR